LATNAQSRTVLRFDNFEVHLLSGELRKKGRPVRLQEQPFQILRALLARPGEIVSREELKQQLWPADTFVDFDDGLNTAVKKLRETLGDSAESPRYIETIPRRGYRFVGEVGEPEASLAGSLESNQKEHVGTHEIVQHRRRPVRLILSLVSLAAVILGVLIVRTSFSTPPAKIQSIAVLPFANLSGDATQDYFADAMTEELTSDLGKIAALRVISRTSAMHYKKVPKTAPEIARELNVDGVIEGSVFRSGDRVRITAQLINARSDRHLWSESYERDLKDILALQSELAQAIVSEIKIQLTPQEREHLASAHTINPDAYDAYLLGNYHASKRNPAAIDKAIEYFQRAIRIDPSYAQAYAGLASAYLEREIWGGVGIGNTADQVRANTLKALELDEDLAEAHALLGRICFGYDWNWARTDKEYRRAIELNANLPNAYEGYAFFLQAMGRHQEALSAVHRAVELDPLSAWYISEEGRILYRARRYGDAIARYQRALELDSTFVPALGRMADAYEQLGKYNEALSYAQKLQQMPGNSGVGLQMLARIYASMGKRHEAEEILSRTIEKSGALGGSNDYARAVIYSALGDHDRAIAALERGTRTHSFFPFVFVDPQLDPLRSDPRFQRLLRRAGIPS